MKKIKTGYLTAAIALAVVIIGIVCFYLFAGINKGEETAYLYIDGDDDMDSVSVKLEQIATPTGVSAVRNLARHTGYTNHVRTGRYALEDGMGALKFFRHLRNGQQDPVKLVVPSVRTKDRLAEEISKVMMFSKDDLLKVLNDEKECEKYGMDTATVVCLFIPNTYEMYWDMKIDKFMERMKKESASFWKGNRQKKADDLKLTPNQVITLASIVDEETANNPEKPMIAGMYYNRYIQGMPLQADPTIKFALQQFSLRRIYNNMLSVQSPYNTYRNIGLPPGPIRVPSVAGIDAVLNLVHHDYLYMCAKEDFSGTHNFAKTYSEHLQNAAKYSEALNKRGVK